MKKDFSKFKVLGITLLVTMSSCVGGSLELNAETLRTYGFEFDISLSDKTQLVGKQKKSKVPSNSKFRFNKIIESGRTHIGIPGISIDYSPLIFQIKLQHFQNPLINRIVLKGDVDFSDAYSGINFQNRAGPTA